MSGSWQISHWVRDDLIWWNILLPQFNEVLFFDVSNRSEFHLYIDACLKDLREYYYEKNKNSHQKQLLNQLIDQEKAFIFILLTMINSVSINVREIEAILLTIQIYEKEWNKTRLLVFTNNTTAFSELINQILKELVNDSLREIHLIAIKWDIVIISH
jgi:hypothetical protein